VRLKPAAEPPSAAKLLGAERRVHCGRDRCRNLTGASWFPASACPVDLMPEITAYGQQSCTVGRAAFIMGQSPIRTGLTKVGLPGSKKATATGEKLGV